MPIYEFYCTDCHTVYSFYAPQVVADAAPPCPRCGRRELPRKPSRFATLKHRGEQPPTDPLESLDDSRLEEAMDTLLHEMEGMENEEDPRSMGRLMRRFTQLTGLELGDKMEDYVRRLEAGEDPDALEQELESAFGDDEGELDDLFQLKKAVRERRRRRPPRIDETLYFL